jgi:hypothetical protein
MDLFLIIVAVLVIWTARAYLVPFAPCRRCQGKKVNRFSGKRRFGPCKSCGGTGSRQVLGSRQVHKAVRSLVAYRSKTKEK